MSAPIQPNSWQQTLPDELPRHMKRNIKQGPGGCWIWTRSRSRDGYGWASYQDRTYQAHRLTFALVKGEPEPGLVLDHLCRVRHCVNPDHMEPVTPRENLARSRLTSTGMTHCLKCGDPLGRIPSQRRCIRCLEAYNESRRPIKAAMERERRAKAKL